MDVVRRKRLTLRALTDLEEVVLDVLYKTRQEFEAKLQPKEIGEWIGIRSASPRLAASISFPIIRGILDRLEDRGLVQQKGPYGPWELTVKGIENQEVKYHANIR